MVGKDSEKPPINRVPGGKRREKLLAEMLVVQALRRMFILPFPSSAQDTACRRRVQAPGICQSRVLPR